MFAFFYQNSRPLSNFRAYCVIYSFFGTLPQIPNTRCNLNVCNLREACIEEVVSWESHKTRCKIDLYKQQIIAQAFTERFYQKSKAAFGCCEHYCDNDNNNNNNSCCLSWALTLNRMTTYQNDYFISMKFYLQQRKFFAKYLNDRNY